MSEDLTQNLPQRSFEERVLAEFAALNSRFTSLEGRMTTLEVRMTTLEGRMTTLEGRMTTLEDHMASFDARLASLEEKVEERLHDTRPMWEGVQARLAGIETEMKSLSRYFRTLTADFFGLRVRVDKLEGESV